MIGKFSKMYNSVFTKIILTVTALSFMSLFGVTGYINTANSNKTVIKVDDIEISQSEFNYSLQRELAKMKAVLGEDFDIQDDKKSEVIAGLAKIKLEDAIIDNTMKKHNVDFSENLIRNIIMITPQFTVDGKFDYETYKWYLNRTGMSEKELIADVKRNVARKVLLDSQLAYMNIPTVMQKQMEKVLGQRRTFKYIKIANDDSKITREPSAEELDQFYADLGDEFRVPEKRDVSIMYLSLDKIAQNVQVSDEEVESAYKEHIDEYVQAEERYVLQMVFDSAEKANEASAKLAQGADFMTLAKENGQKQEDTDLGFVSAENLLPELSDVVFATGKNGVSAPIELNGEWQIIKVTDIKAKNETPKAMALAKIANELKQEKAYDGSYEIITSIEDKIGAGSSLSDIAKEYNVSLIEVKSLGEDGTSDSRNLDISEVLQNKDVIDAAFSYNEGETSQAVETDNGIAVIEINKVIESHIQPKEQIADKIKQIWLENEKASITQETIDNIEHDLEAGDDLSAVAGRYKLTVKKTMPLTRSETFDDLAYPEIKNLFTLPIGETRIIKVGDNYVVAETTNIYDDSASLEDKDKKLLTQSLYAEVLREMSNALLQDFASHYDVRVKYNRMGFND